MKIFDQAAARTGLRDHEARAAGFDPVTVGSEADDHKAYYPGSHRIAMRFTGDRATGRLLGVQLFGHKNAEIAKRIDVAATAIFHGMTVVHRSDGSGTTYIFSNYLSTVSPAWATQVGTGRSLHWPTGYGADGNPGVAAAISHIAFAIGYIERSYAKGPALAYAAIENQAGHYTIPTTEAIAADAAARPVITADSFSIVNEPGPASYPICGYSWVLVSVRQPSQAAGQALAALLGWLTHAGQAYADTLGYVPLPPAIQQLATSTLQQLTGPDGTLLS